MAACDAREGERGSAAQEARRESKVAALSPSAPSSQRPAETTSEHVWIRRTQRGQQGPHRPLSPRSLLRFPPSSPHPLTLVIPRRSASPRPSRSQRSVTSEHERTQTAGLVPPCPTLSPLGLHRSPFGHAWQTIVHYGWIPTILVVAWRSSNPRPPIMRCAVPPPGSFSLAELQLTSFHSPRQPHLASRMSAPLLSLFLSPLLPRSAQCTAYPPVSRWFGILRLSSHLASRADGSAKDERRSIVHRASLLLVCVPPDLTALPRHHLRLPTLPLLPLVPVPDPALCCAEYPPIPSAASVSCPSASDELQSE